MKKCFIIIDGFSSGAILIDKLYNHYGSDVIFFHIITNSLVEYSNIYGHKFITDNPLYVEEYLYDENFDSLIKKFNNYNIIGVICGAEGDGIILREKLAKHYNLNYNNMDMLEARRNKFAMGECLKNANLNHIKQFLVRSPNELDNILDNKLVDFPLILKPIDGGNSHGFHKCNDISSLKSAFYNLYLSKNVFNKQNQQLLLQNYINGQEFAINTISINGKIFTTDIWSYENKISINGQRQCLSCTLETLEDKQELIKYTEKCLDALGYWHGAAHTEVIKQDEKFYMIESGARLMGSIPDELVRKCLSITQAHAYILAITDPSSLDMIKPQVNNYLKIVNILSEIEGELVSIANFEKISNLSSYHSFVQMVKPGNRITATNSSDNCIGRIILLNSNKKQLEEDYLYIRSVEKDTFNTQTD